MNRTRRKAHKMRGRRLTRTLVVFDIEQASYPYWVNPPWGQSTGTVDTHAKEMRAIYNSCT